LVVSGGTSITNIEDAIAADGGGRWEITYSDIQLRTVEDQRRWSQWIAHLAGGARVVLVPIVSLRTAPRPYGGGGLMKPSQIYTDDSVFPTITRFATPYITAVTVGTVPLRGTTMTINVTKGARIEGGEKFSIGERAHVIERVLSQSGQTATCPISPPTREAIPAGSLVNFEWPYVRCRAVIGQDMSPDYLIQRYGTISISFVEDFSDDD